MLKLSICVPTFNRADSLDSTLRDIYNGICSMGRVSEEIEVIVSNNASTDNTREICTKYPVKYIEQKENLGYDGNILELYSKSSGEYILFVSDDDVFEYKSLEILLKLLHEYEGVDVVFCNWYSSDGRDKISYLPARLLNEKKIFEFEMVCDLVPFYFLSSFVLKKVKIDTSKVLHRTFATQMQIALEILQKESKCITMQEYLVGRIEPMAELEGGCNMSSNSWKIHLGFAKVKRKYQKKFNIPLSPLAEIRSALSSLEYLNDSNKPILKRLNVFISSIICGCRSTSIKNFILLPDYLLHKLKENK